MDAPTRNLQSNVLDQTATHTLVPPTDEELESYSIGDADKLVMLAFSNLQTAARVYKREGLTQPQMLERLSLLGIKTSLRTIQYVFADLRKAQDPNFKPVGSSNNTEATRKRKYRAKQNGTNRKSCGMSQPEKSTPIITPCEVITDVSLSEFETERSYSRKSNIPGLFDLQPDLDSDVERSLEPDLSVVGSYDPKRDTCHKELGDLRVAITRIHQIIDRNSNTRIPNDERFTEHQWKELDEELQACADLCHTSWQQLREQMDGIREAVVTNATNALRSARVQSIEEG
jgi:hypothetical protein